MDDTETSPRSTRLVAIATCEARTAFTAAQRATWVKDCGWADVRFFLAAQLREPLADEIFLDVGDDYKSLPAKVREISRWASKQNYLQTLKLDDDVVMWPTRVVFPQGHYTGWIQEPTPGFAKHCSGLAYWLSADCMKTLAEAEIGEETAEDRWTGQVLWKAGFRPNPIERGGLQWVGRRRPLAVNIKAIVSRAYVAGEFTPEEMATIYSW